MNPAGIPNPNTDAVECSGHLFSVNVFDVLKLAIPVLSVLGYVFIGKLISIILSLTIELKAEIVWKAVEAYPQ
ncbi:MAG: hypothetical protein WD824_06820 [Cyclobacteriaceae bacterium]